MKNQTIFYAWIDWVFQIFGRNFFSNICSPKSKSRETREQYIVSESLLLAPSAMSEFGAGNYSLKAFFIRSDKFYCDKLHFAT